MKILLAADGSDYSRRAAEYVAAHFADLPRPPEVHVLNVHPELPYRRAASALGKKALERYYLEEGDKAIAVATRVLDDASVPYRSALRVGDVLDEIAKYVKKARIDLIVMGSHGHGAIAGLALGSVTAKVIAALRTPVLIVR